MTWSCLIDADKANPHGLEIQAVSEPAGKFRVKLRPDGVSDWITLLGDKCPVSGAVKVSVSGSYADLSGVRADVVNWSTVDRFRVHGTPEPAKKQGRYMVSVDGFSLGKECDWDSAIAEARRVGSQPSNIKSTVRILQVVATLPPVGERQVVMAEEEA